jgi:hypothetical protein
MEPREPQVLQELRELLGRQVRRVPQVLLEPQVPQEPRRRCRVRPVRQDTSGVMVP